MKIVFFIMNNKREIDTVNHLYLDSRKSKTDSLCGKTKQSRIQLPYLHVIIV